MSIMDKFYRRDFAFRFNFITSYLSRRIASKRIDCSVPKLLIKMGSDVTEMLSELHLIVGMPFDRAGYEKAARNDDFNHYCNIIREAIYSVYDLFAPVAKELIALLDEFEASGYINKWQYKQDIIIKEHDLKARFMQVLTTDAYTLEGHFYSISEKRELCSGTIFRTIPDVAYYLDAFNKITALRDKIQIDAYLYEYLIGSIDIPQLKEGTFNFTYSDGADLTEWQREYLLGNLKKQLSFEGNSFYYGEYRINRSR